MLSLTVMPVVAQMPADSTAGGAQTIDGIEVVAHRVERDARASHPMQTMDAARLRTLGVDALSDAVKRFAGVSVQDYGGLGGLKTVSVRNLGAHHTAVSYDGVTVSNTQAGQIDLSRFATDNVQTLTLVVGEGDDIMQTARHNASAAVLEIARGLPPLVSGRDNALRVKMKTGSWGLVSPAVNYWQRAGYNSVISLDAMCTSADGMYPYTLSNGKQTMNGKRHNSDIMSWQAEANLNTRFADSSRLAIKANWFGSRRGLPGAVIYYNDESSERMSDEEFFVQAVYRRAMGGKWKLGSCAKFSHTWNEYTDNDVKYPGGVKNETNRQNEYYASATVGWFPAAGFAVALAHDVAVNTLAMRREDAPDPVRLTMLTALTSRWTVGPLELNAALTGTFATEKVESGGHPPVRRRLSPSLSASWRPLPTVPLYVRLSAKHTFRMPTFNDMYYDRIGSLALRPERAREYNVGLTWTVRPSMRFRRVSLAVDAYHNDVRDKIVATPTLYVWKMANYGRVSIDGVSATLAVEASVTAGVTLTAQGAYDYQRSVDVTSKSSAYYKHQLPYTPQHSGSASLILSTPWVDVGYTLLGCGRRYSMVQHTSEYLIKGYCDQSLSLSRRLHIGKTEVGLQAVMRNIADSHYEVIKFYPMPGRAFDMTVDVRF